MGSGNVNLDLGDCLASVQHTATIRSIARIKRSEGRGMKMRV